MKTSLREMSVWPIHGQHLFVRLALRTQCGRLRKVPADRTAWLGSDGKSVKPACRTGLRKDTIRPVVRTGGPGAQRIIGRCGAHPQDETAAVEAAPSAPPVAARQ